MHISYAQNFEDILLWRALKNINNGFYIDVGANDPVIDSVTNLFYENGWSGINIEPISACYEKLMMERPRDINLKVAAYSHPCELTIYEFGGTSGLSTVDKSIAFEHKDERQLAYISSEVSALTLNQVCSQHRKGPIHFLKIDVEGAEREVLLGLDLQKIRPWIILIESTLPLSKIESFENWEGLITSSNYEFAWFDGLNRFYVAKEHAILKQHFSVPPNVFDEFALSGKSGNTFCGLVNTQSLQNLAKFQLAQDSKNKVSEQAANLSQELMKEQENSTELALRLREQELQATQSLIVNGLNLKIKGILNLKIYENKRDFINMKNYYENELMLIKTLNSWRLIKYLRWINRQVKLIREAGVRSRLISLKKILVRNFYRDRSSIYKQSIGEDSIRNLGSLQKLPVKLSIIIINFNSDDLIFRCIDSISKSKCNFGLEIIVVNNDINTNIKNIITLYPTIKFIDNRCNRYFGEANNIGVEQAIGKYICFLNADAFVQPDTFQLLISKIESSNEIAAVGPVFLNIDGTIQEAGGEIDSNGFPIRYFRGENLSAVKLDDRFVGYISAACLILRKKEFIEIGGYDLRYEPAYYEDADLCSRLRNHFGTICLVANAKVHHMEGGTGSKNTFIKNLGDINREKYLHAIKSHERKLLNLTRDRINFTNHNEEVLVVFSPYDLTYGGGEKYLFGLIQYLEKKYSKIIISGPNPYSNLRLRQLTEIMGFKFRAEFITYDKLENIKNIELFIALTNYKSPTVRGIGKKNIYICQFPFESLRSEKESIEILEGYSNALVYSQFVKNELISKIPKSVEVNILSPYVSIGNLEVKKVRNKITTIGRFFVGGHNKRHDFLIEEFSKLYKNYKDIELNIIGTTMPDEMHMNHLTHLQNMAKGMPIRFHVNIDEEDVKKILSESEFYWHATGINENIKINPERFEHFGISIVEAMRYGCIPIVPGYGGPLEILGDELIDLTFKNSNQFQEINKKLFNDEKLVNFYRDKVMEKYDEFSYDNFVSKCKKFI